MHGPERRQMGLHDVEDQTDPEQMRTFMRALLDDVAALETMLDGNQFETGIRRIGAEQEMFLIDKAHRPSPRSVEVLQKLNGDSRFVSELARFNLEANASPRTFGGSCLSEMEEELLAMVGTARETARSMGSDILLCGILPTLRLTDLGLNNMSPNPRYFALNRAMMKLRGGHFRVDIKGLDELHCEHDNVMLESANTSFQLHFQVAPEEFAKLYNLAQAVTAPVLAVAVNSPTLLGNRLWNETRVALFQQSVDARTQLQSTRGHRPRVDFGGAWVDDSVIEIFREDISRFRIVLAIDKDEDPQKVLARGEIPELSALRLHNGTVYRWNRPCYGVHNGVAHLRVENRVLPSGPTVLDEVANAAFYFGLMSGLTEEYGEVKQHMKFDDAKNNFFAAARHGLQAQFRWFNGRSITAQSLVTDELLPLARQGLKQSELASADIDRYLGVIEERVASGQTGAQWALSSWADMPEDMPKAARLRSLVSTTLRQQHTNVPVHKWDRAKLDDEHDWRNSYKTVAQFMTTDVFTAQPEDLVDIAASVMDWESVRHIPVEDGDGNLIGLLTHRDLMRLVAKGVRTTKDNPEPVTVASVMKKNPPTARPEMTSLEAIDLMRSTRSSCLPVVEGGRLVGIITEADFLRVAQYLLIRELKREEE